MILPALNRRRLLLGLAAASTAAAVPAAALATTEPAPVPENPELLCLGDMLPGVEADMIDAEADYWRIYRDWSPSWPIAPDAITWTSTWGTDSKRERNILGWGMLPDGSTYNVPQPYVSDHPQPRYVNTADDYRREIDELQKKLRRSRPKHPLSASEVADIEAAISMARGNLELASTYEAAKEGVKAASGIEAAIARRRTTQEALAELVGKIMAQPEQSMAGVLIKAQALAAWGNNPFHDFHVAGTEWPQRLAFAVLRLAKEGAAERAGTKRPDQCSNTGRGMSR